jgi:ribonuclease HI
MSKAFYAVANGRVPGVFLTWGECEKSVKDFPGAKFKKFTSEQEAKDFCKTPTKSFTKSTQAKYSNITFDSDSESDQEPIVKTKSVSYQKKSVPAKQQVNNFINTRAEEEVIRANINFDTSDSESETESKPQTKLIIEDMDNQSELDDDLEVMMKNLSNKKSESKLKSSHTSVLSELGDFNPDIIVYTDGACIDNGGPNAKAGIGVYFGPEDPRNVSELVQGKQSNNTAELGALSRAYSILSQEISTGKKVAFFTDSLYALQCLTSYGDKCAQMGWVRNIKTDKEIANKELVKQIYEQFGCKTNPNIKLIHIKAHTGAQDAHSLGNDQADKLANAAIGIVQAKKIYLKVPFAKKDQAKKLGCRWDPDAKSWYCFESNTKALEQLGGKI